MYCGLYKLHTVIVAIDAIDITIVKVNFSMSNYYLKLGGYIMNYQTTIDKRNFFNLNLGLPTSTNEMCIFHSFSLNLKLARHNNFMTREFFL